MTSLGSLSGVDGVNRLDAHLWAPTTDVAADATEGRDGRTAPNVTVLSASPVDLEPASQVPPQVDLLAGALLAAGLVASVMVPALMCIHGIMMSAQSQDVMLDTANATILSLVVSLLIVRRILTFPLLRSLTYIVIAFVSVSLATGALLKLFKVNFSSPQFYIATLLSIGVVEVFLLMRRKRARPIFAVLPTVDDPDLGRLALARRAICHPLVAVPSDVSRFNAIIADLRHDLAPEWERLLALAALRGIPVFHVKQFREMMSGRVAVDHLWENTVAATIPALVYPQLKRFIDLVAALALLPFILPILLIAGVAIRLESPGPALFRQDRIGYGGKTFSILKLRTMRIDDGKAGSAFTHRDDPRITRLGAIFRQYRIDELPQVFNIIMGHMSWIGPRPEAVSLATWYEREIAFYAYRHVVRPGITGWAQVNQGNVAQIDAARVKLEYDFFYIKHFSFWLDAIIVVKTIRTILTRFGAH